MNTIALDHSDTCTALEDWRSKCSCGVGIEEISIPIAGLEVTYVSIIKLLVELKLSQSRSSAARLIKSGAVEIVDDDERRTASFSEWVPFDFYIHCGRHWRRVKLT